MRKSLIFGFGLLATFAQAGLVLAGTAGPTSTMKLTSKLVTLTAPSNSYYAATKQLTPLRIPNADQLNAIKAAAAKSTVKRGAAVQQREAAGTQALVKAACNLNAANGFAPSDVHGAVSKTNIVEVTNVLVRNYQKAGACALVTSNTLNAFFSAPAGQTVFDPRVIYDRGIGRFIVVAESSDFSGATDDQYQYFAVSTNSVGTSYFVYTLPLSVGASRFCKTATSSFWDYPSLGKNLDRIFITANDFGASVTGAILSIQKAPTTTGGSTTVACFSGLTFNIAPPYVLDTDRNTVHLSPGSGGGSTITRYNILTNSGSPGGDIISTLPSVAIPAWTAPPNANQPNGTTLDVLDGRFQSSSIQSRRLLWNVHAVDLSGAVARVYKLGADSANTSAFVISDLFTSGTDRVFNPSVATGSGAFNAPIFVTASRTDPALGNTPNGRASHLMFSGLNSTNSEWKFDVVSSSPTQFIGCSPCRWGDYSSTQVDPGTSGRAWGFNQKVTGTSEFNWGTTAAPVELDLTVRPSH